MTTRLFNAFDSAPSLFWSEKEQQYVLYFRYSIRGKPRGPDIIPGVRTVARATSVDLVHWSEPTPMIYGNDGPEPPENLYTNGTHPYFRAPHIYVAFPARFMPGRRVIHDRQLADLDMATFHSGHYHFDCADSVLMTSRGGNRYARTFMGVFIRPGPGPSNWGSRSNYALRGVVQTGPTEMSLYVNRHYAQATWHVQRMTLRLDGFTSVRAPYQGGELLTRPLAFCGRHLFLNYATSAAGSVRVEVQTASGNPVPGFALSDCREVFGDHVERGVAWKGHADLGALAGKPVRLRFAMKDADLYSLRFQKEPPKQVAYKVVEPVVVPADPSLDFPGGQMTVEAFVYVIRPASAHPGERILSKYNHLGGDNTQGLGVDRLARRPIAVPRQPDHARHQGSARRPNADIDKPPSVGEMGPHRDRLRSPQPTSASLHQRQAGYTTRNPRCAHAPHPGPRPRFGTLRRQECHV